MLAEEEPAVRAISKRILESEGHSVVEARDGTEAVQLFLQSPHWFDCVIVDLVMPGLDGLEVCARIRAIRSNLPILIASGQPIDEGREQSFGGSVGFLLKPYARDELTRALSAVVEVG